MSESSGRSLLRFGRSGSVGGDPSPRSRRRLWAGVAVTCLAIFAFTIAIATADNVAGFEIDASNTNGALYSGTDTPQGNDWAQGLTQSGVFQLTPPNGTPDFPNCYGSNVSRIQAAGPSAFICVGNSDTKFKNTQPEQNIVSPSGKTPDDVWPVKPGNVRPKNDFSHAYTNGVFLDSPCDVDTLNDDLMLRLGGHVGDNEGSHFWGFEFDKTAPGGFASLKANGGASFNLDFNRQQNDLLISFTVPGNANDPVVLDVFRVASTPAAGQDATFVQAVGNGCPAGQPQGLTSLATNNSNDVKAPPWNVPACDPTATNASNSCRSVNGGATDNLLAPRDFAEANVDLTAFGITDPCFTNVIFTSRSSHPLEGADIQDVGGGDFPLCGTKSGTKFHDRNADGDRDSGDEGLAGWSIFLYRDTDGDGVLDAAELASKQTATTIADDPATTGVDEAGRYSFPNLGQGKFIACEKAQGPGTGGVPSSGWFQSAPLAATDVTDTCDNDTGNAERGYKFEMSGTDHPGNDFGNYRNATISGMKFKDADADGVKDGSEGGLSGWVIHLFGPGGSHTTTTTVADDPATTGVDETGRYSFPNLAPGAYTVCEQLTGQANWVQTFPVSGNGIADCSTKIDPPPPTLGGKGYDVTTTSDTTFGGRDFGNAPQSDITVTFNPLAVLPKPPPNDATKATKIECKDQAGTVVGSTTTANTVTTNKVLTSASKVTCTIEFVDP